MTTPAPAPEQTAERPQSLTPSQLTFLHANALNRYVTDTGKILPRRLTGLTASQQREITRAIKRGRAMLTLQ
jgi:small subunit ribosomal protein S18